MTNKFRSALLAAGAMLAASAASAQGYYDNNGYQDDHSYQGPPEEVIVVAPDYYAHRAYPSSPTRAPEQTTLSLPVSYSDLDLTTRDGAQELRERVRDAAHDICGELASRYPIKMANSPSCYKKAVETGLNRANSAIHQVRAEYRDGYEY